MATINVLIVVDALGAATSGLPNNVYLVDTHKHIGSGNEGQAELYTTCHDGDVIVWAISPVDPGSDVSINSFTGQMIDSKICTPVQQTGPDSGSWDGRVEAQGQKGNIQYSVVVNVDGTPMQFDPFLVVS